MTCERIYRKKRQAVLRPAHGGEVSQHRGESKDKTSIVGCSTRGKQRQDIHRWLQHAGPVRDQPNERQKRDRIPASDRAAPLLLPPSLATVEGLRAEARKAWFFRPRKVGPQFQLRLPREADSPSAPVLCSRTTAGGAPLVVNICHLANMATLIHCLIP